jgi:hypothetical protein
MKPSAGAVRVGGMSRLLLLFLALVAVVAAPASALGAPSWSAPAPVPGGIGDNVAAPPYAALDPVSGRSFVAYSLLSGGVWVSARP